MMHSFYNPSVSFIDRSGCHSVREVLPVSKENVPLLKRQAIMQNNKFFIIASTQTIKNVTINKSHQPNGLSHWLTGSRQMGKKTHQEQI